MADTKQIAPADNSGPPPPPRQPRGPTKYQKLNELYALPAPLRTFPLPTFVPHNPLSLFHIFYVWLSQTIQAPSSHFETPYFGWFSPNTRSVHVTDSRSIRGLWEQGFYGKGSLSRSEPNWLDREKNRRGDTSRVTSEQITRQRRTERQQTKWERARKEREAIDQTLLEEAEAASRKVPQCSSTSLHVKPSVGTALKEGLGDQSLENGSDEGIPWTEDSKLFVSPVDPRRLLALPNAPRDLNQVKNCGGTFNQGLTYGSNDSAQFVQAVPKANIAPVGPLEILALPNSHEDKAPANSIDKNTLEDRFYEQDHAVGNNEPTSIITLHPGFLEPESCFGINVHAKTAEMYVNDVTDMNGVAAGDPPHTDSTSSNCVAPKYPIHNGSALSNGSPKPGKTRRQKSVRFSPTVEQNTFIQTEPPSPERAAATMAAKVEEQPQNIQDQEHFQLTMEEAFFLSYSLGALTILDPATKSAISNERLFSLFRKSSYFPPLSYPGVSPDDPFVISYVVYHHFRSLGWVVRGGTKFSVDYILYNRGPVFSHAEFGVIILPSYSDPYWRSDPILEKYVKGKEKRSWSWMHCINRVITQVKKTLILVYVDIPPPLDSDHEKELGLDGILGRYKVREIVVKRWLSNRSRDL